MQLKYVIPETNKKNITTLSSTDRQSQEKVSDLSEVKEPAKM
jgi:hypothetical protein